METRLKKLMEIANSRAFETIELIHKLKHDLNNIQFALDETLSQHHAEVRNANLLENALNELERQRG